MANTFVKDVMNKEVIAIDEQKTIKNAADKMTKANVGCIIVTKNKKPVGILTERDFVRKIASKNKPLETKLSLVMSKPLITIDSGELVWEAAEIMKQKNIHKLPVLKDDAVVGIITTTDLVEICSIGSDSSMRKICDQILLRMEKDFKK